MVPASNWGNVMRAVKVMKNQTFEAQYRQIFRGRAAARSGTRAAVSLRGDDESSLEQPFVGEVVDSKTTTYSVLEESQERLTELCADAELE
jgi:hypothetical protein